MEYKYQQLHLKKQHGAVVVILAAGMAALLAVAGLALDSGNLFLNKSKLQNAADVSALSAGVALNAAGGNYQKAVASAVARFESVIASEGNQALQEAYNSNEIGLTVTTSPTLSPFVGSNADDDWYVRVAVSALQIDSFFLRVIGIDTLNVPASAVAGRTPVGVSNPSGGNDINPICGVAPMMVCGDPSSNEESNCGYEFEETQILKATAQCQSITGDGVCVKPATAEDWSVGTGNFQLIQLSDADGNPLTAVLVTGPGNAAVAGFTLNTDGSFDYTQDGSETTGDSFTYKANDGLSDSNTVTVSLTITAVNDNAPLALADSYTVAEGGTLNEVAPGVLDNGREADGDGLAEVAGRGAHHAAEEGFTLSNDGSFECTPDGSETGGDRLN